jgi:cupin fold WbuC family metalloprotein
MRTKPFNSEVLYPDEPIVQVAQADVAWLKAQAEQTERKRIRLCAHKNVDDSLHEMLIVHTRDTYVRPHKHLDKSESFHVIEGWVDVVLFDDDGEITDVIQMGDYSSGYCFYYRIADPRYHTLLIHSDVLVFHETTNGPFSRSQTAFASWSPTENNTAAVGEFMSKLAKTAATFRSVVE